MKYKIVVLGILFCVVVSVSYANKLELAILKAVENNDIKKVENLLSLGADANARYEHDMTILMKAAELGYVDIVELLLDNNAGVNAVCVNGTPLIFAIHSQNLETVKVILEYGADVEFRPKKAWTPLMIAIREGDVEIVKYLIDNGANINNVLGNGWTPLMLAAMKNPTLTKLILDSGADVNILNKNDWTALDFAIRSGNEDTINMLKDAAASRK